MRTLERIVPTVAAWFMAIGLAGPALGGLSVTATLLPAREALVLPAPDPTAFPPTSDGETWLYVASGHAEVLLEFDLSAIPAGATIGRCSLRLVAQTAIWSADPSKSNPVTVQLLQASLVNPGAWEERVPDWSKIQPSSEGSAIVDLSPLRRGSKPARDSDPPRLVALNTDDTKLRLKVAEIVRGSGTKRLQLRVFSDTKDSSSRLFSSQAKEYSKRPRLVVQYQTQPSLANEVAWRQYQFGPEHTGLCPVFQYKPPDGYGAGAIALPKNGTDTLAIVTDPVVCDDQIILVVRNETKSQNWLYALSHAGTLLWKTKLKDTLTVPAKQRQPAVSLGGILYQSWKQPAGSGLDRIVGYDLKQRGEQAAVVAERTAKELEGNPTDITELTVGNDGSLFFAAGERLYGLTRALEPFFQLGVTEMPKGVTLSQDGRWLYAGTSKGLVVVDLINPPIVAVSPFRNDINDKPLFVSSETVPVALPGSTPTSTADNPPKLATSSNAGVNVLKLKLGDGETVAGVDTFWRAENGATENGATMTNSPPVLGGASTLYWIQSGNLFGQGTLFKDAPRRHAGQSGLGIMSNLVIDGNERLTFWEGSNYRAFDGHGTKGDDTDIAEPALRPKVSLPGLEGGKATLRWIIGPDGTRYAQNVSYIYMLRPKYAKSSSLELAQQDLKHRHQTILAPDKVSTSKPIVVTSGSDLMDLIFESSAGFRVPSGGSFRVQKGARASIRIAPDVK